MEVFCAAAGTVGFAAVRAVNVAAGLAARTVAAGRDERTPEGRSEAVAGEALRGVEEELLSAAARPVSAVSADAGAATARPITTPAPTAAATPPTRPTTADVISANFLPTPVCRWQHNLATGGC
jgi:hypothetical protein